MKHTPGPWKAVFEKRNGMWVRTADGVISIACLIGHPGAEANALLMAAAPDLLKACESSLKRLKEIQAATGYPTAFPQVELEEAIRKAGAQ